MQYLFLRVSTAFKKNLEYEKYWADFFTFTYDKNVVKDKILKNIWGKKIFIYYYTNFSFSLSIGYKNKKLTKYNKLQLKEILSWETI